jgi:hypothetical protein
MIGVVDRQTVAASSSAVVTDPTKSPPTHEPRTLRGRMSMRADGYWVPAATDATKSFETSMYDVVTRLFDTANGLDRLRQVMISDYGRLRTLGAVADRPGWTIDIGDTATMLCNAAETFFYSELMPIPYGTYALVGEFPYRFDGNPDNCYDQTYGWTWNGAPATAQMEWMGASTRAGITVPRVGSCSAGTA